MRLVQVALGDLDQLEEDFPLFVVDVAHLEGIADVDDGLPVLLIQVEASAIAVNMLLRLLLENQNHSVLVTLQYIVALFERTRQVTREVDILEVALFDPVDLPAVEPQGGMRDDIGIGIDSVLCADGVIDIEERLSD